MNKQIPVGLQLWSVRDDIKTDFAAAVSKVAEIGYRYVEMAGYGNLDAPKAQKAIATAGLKAISTHASFVHLKTELNRIVDEAKLFGVKHVVCSSPPPEALASRQTCEQLGKEFDEIGARLREHQLALSFHNHAKEFTSLDGRYALDWIMDSAAPRNLGSQLDVYWAFFAKVDCSTYIRPLGRRVTSLHIKDGFLSEKRDTCEIGFGKVPFEDIFKTIEAIGTVEFYIVEQEDYKFPPMECVKKSFETLKRWNKV